KTGDAHHLVCDAGDLVLILRRENDQWWYGQLRRTKARGWVPASYLQVVPKPADAEDEEDEVKTLTPAQAQQLQAQIQREQQQQPPQQQQQQQQPYLSQPAETVRQAEEHASPRQVRRNLNAM